MATKKKARALWAKRFRAAFGFHFTKAMRYAKLQVKGDFTYDLVKDWPNQSTHNSSGYYDGVYTETTLIGLDGSQWTFHNHGYLWDRDHIR